MWGTWFALGNLCIKCLLVLDCDWKKEYVSWFRLSCALGLIDGALQKKNVSKFVRNVEAEILHDLLTCFVELCICDQLASDYYLRTSKHPCFFKNLFLQFVKFMFCEIIQSMTTFVLLMSGVKLWFCNLKNVQFPKSFSEQY